MEWQGLPVSPLADDNHQVAEQRRLKTRLNGDFHPASREIKQERRPT